MKTPAHHTSGAVTTVANTTQRNLRHQAFLSVAVTGDGRSGGSDSGGGGGGGGDSGVGFMGHTGFYRKSAENFTFLGGTHRKQQPFFLMAAAQKRRRRNCRAGCSWVWMGLPFHAPWCCCLGQNPQVLAAWSADQNESAFVTVQVRGSGMRPAARLPSGSTVTGIRSFFAKILFTLSWSRQVYFLLNFHW